MKKLLILFILIVAILPLQGQSLYRMSASLNVLKRGIQGNLEYMLTSRQSLMVSGGFRSTFYSPFAPDVELHYRLRLGAKRLLPSISRGFMLSIYGGYEPNNGLINGFSGVNYRYSQMNLGVLLGYRALIGKKKNWFIEPNIGFQGNRSLIQIPEWIGDDQFFFFRPSILGENGTYRPGYVVFTINIGGSFWRVNKSMSEL